MDQVGESSGGCNPWPILEEDKTETDSEINILRIFKRILRYF